MKTDREKLGHVFREQIIRRDCYGLRRTPHPPGIVLDIGGNMGMFSLMARVLYPEARIVCLEPHPETFDRLEWNLRFFDIELHRLALSDAPTVGFRKGGDSGSNSTVAGGDVRGMGLREICKRLNVDPSHTFLKVDCEGGERQIIESMDDSLYLLHFIGAGFEMHYSDGRGAHKWANAISRQRGETWVQNLQFLLAEQGSRWSDYKADRLGGMLRYGLSRG